MTQSPHDTHPHDTQNWEFYIAATTYINKTLGPTQKKVSLGKLRKLQGVKKVSYEEIKETIDDMIRAGEAKTNDYSDDGVNFLFFDE